MKVNGNSGSTYAVGLSRPGDEAAARRLLHGLIGETRVTRWTPEFWRWKHRDSPFGPSWVVAARHRPSDEVVCVQHAMRWAFTGRNGERVEAARPCDGATAPQHQRRGLYTATDELLQDELRASGARVAIGTPNDKTLGMELKTGWSVATRAPLLLRPVISPPALLRTALGAGSEPEPNSLLPGLESFARFEERFGAPQVAEVVADHEGLRRRVGYRTPRDMDYLRWRYRDLPTTTYYAWAMRSTHRLEGFVILRLATGFLGIPALVINEMFLRQPVTDAAALVRKLVRAVRWGYLLAIAADGTTEHRALRRAGFLRMPRQYVIVTARQLRSVPHPVDQAGSWDLTFGELEVF